MTINHISYDPTFRPSISSNDCVNDATFFRSSSASSHRQSLDLNFSVSGRSSPEKMYPQIYLESDQRRKEREEAHKVRMALEKMDLRDEQRSYSAAQQEVVEYLWKHQNPEVPYYVPTITEKEGLNEVHAFIDNSYNTARVPDPAPDRSCSQASSRKSSAASSKSDMKGQASAANADTWSRKPENMSADCQPPTRVVKTDHLAGSKLGDQLPYSKPRHTFSLNILSNRRRSSGTKRNISAASQKGRFPSGSEKIYEDPPEQSVTVNPPAGPPGTLAHGRRNPFARARSARSGLPMPGPQSPPKRPSINRVEIQRNPPSQSRDPNYLSNAAVPTAGAKKLAVSSVEEEPASAVRFRDGVEVRSDEIRAATSWRRKDRSPKLPSPTVVSNKLGRPIVSFAPDWKPSEEHVDEESSNPSSRRSRPSPIPYRLCPDPIKSTSLPVVPTLHLFNVPEIVVMDAPAPCRPLVVEPELAVIPKKRNGSTNKILQIKVEEVPSVQIDECPSPGTHRIPTVKTPETLSTSTNNATPKAQLQDDHDRPLPAPSVSRPPPRHATTAPIASRPHWTPSVRRTTALCAQCGLSIAGRIVSAAGVRFHPECFTCHHCSEGLECVAFYPEPAEKRAARVNSIECRMKGEKVEAIEGSNQADDGDDSLRFYCHLDFHEFFSPRCKSCKTPIEGEVIVACGAEWHVGHFFCAQCGDVSIVPVM